ncbi:MAG: pseudouridine synthase, partial [Bacteroidales bacterium]|nr:pseudouridine synthase [Bacteroidales bacterium]
RFGSDRRFGNEDRRGSFNREDRGGRRFGGDRRFDNEDRRSSFGRDERASRRFGNEDRRGSFRGDDRGGRRFGGDNRRSFDRDEFRPRFKRQERGDQARHAENITKKEAGYIRLNRYISNAGICSRREADTMIESGVILVNGQVCTVLGTLVGPNDKVQFGGQTLNAEKKVYLLMNKPKGYITTADDPQERKTVMELVRDACRERIYPVGRLDRNTTGVLLFTNDGDVAKNLTHPSHGARKIYHVTLDNPLTKADLTAIAKGVMLEDGFTEVDEISYVEEGDRREVGILLHSGKSRFGGRICEQFGYDVAKLDRVLFAELTKKDLKRGQWRFLTEQEINFLKVNAGGKTANRKPKAGKKEVFTAEQLEEAEALALADETPVKKRATRKKAVAEAEEETPVKKRA